MTDAPTSPPIVQPRRRLTFNALTWGPLALASGSMLITALIHAWREVRND